MTGEDRDPEVYGALFERALLLAVDLHRGQLRKGTRVPYITHPLAVASLVGEAGGSEQEVAAALLHDAAEDAGGHETLARIRASCGDLVAEVVAGCTDAWVEPKPPWRERKEAFLARLESAPGSVLLVTAADKLHNARSIVRDLAEAGPDALWSRFRAGREGTLWYYGAVVEVLTRRNASARLVPPLEHVVRAMSRLG
jgi:(p)ppGpp synthase/HD superfamily hydrolase